MVDYTMHTLKIYLKRILLLLAVSLITACAGNSFLHNSMMKGQVVSVKEGIAIVCVGSGDDISPGQSLSVYRVNRNLLYDGDGDGFEEDEFTLKYVGKVSIGSIINDHFAKAIVTQGEIAAYDIVRTK